MSRDASKEWDYLRVSIASATTTLTAFAGPTLLKGAFVNSATNGAVGIRDGSSQVLEMPQANAGDTFDFEGLRLKTSLVYNVTAISGSFTLLYKPLDYD